MAFGPGLTVESVLMTKHAVTVAREQKAKLSKDSGSIFRGAAVFS